MAWKGKELGSGDLGHAPLSDWQRFTKRFWVPGEDLPDRIGDQERDAVGDRRVHGAPVQLIRACKLIEDQGSMLISHPFLVQRQPRGRSCLSARDLHLAPPG